MSAVEIVATGMHYGDVVSGVVFGMDFAGVGEAGFFFDGKGVEFGAEHDGRAGSVLEDGDNAGAADCFGDFVAQGAETSGEFGGGLGFVRGELGRLMKIEVEIVGGGIDGVDFLGRNGALALRKSRESQGEGDKGDGYFHGERMIAIDDRPGKTECDRCRSAGYERKALTTGHTGFHGECASSPQSACWRSTDQIWAASLSRG
jgi:hypothetical protein